MDPFAASGNMVQNLPCWRASYALGHPKQRRFKCDKMQSLCFGCPSAQLALQQGGFCTMWPLATKDASQLQFTCYNLSADVFFCWCSVGKNFCPLTHSSSNWTKSTSFPGSPLFMLRRDPGNEGGVKSVRLFGTCKLASRPIGLTKKTHSVCAPRQRLRETPLSHRLQYPYLLMVLIIMLVFLCFGIGMNHLICRVIHVHFHGGRAWRT